MTPTMREKLIDAACNAEDKLSGDTIGVVIYNSEHLFPSERHFHDGAREHDAYELAARFIVEQAVDAILNVLREPDEAMIEAANIADRGMMPWADQFRAAINTITNEGRG